MATHYASRADIHSSYENSLLSGSSKEDNTPSDVLLFTKAQWSTPGVVPGKSENDFLGYLRFVFDSLPIFGIIHFT